MILLYGRYGVGKTTLMSTAPGDILILDPEFGAKDLDMPTYPWLPGEDFPKIAREDVGRSVIRMPISKWSNFVWAHDQIKTGMLPVKTICLDTLTELQVKAGIPLSGEVDLRTMSAKKHGWDEWHALKQSFTKIITDFATLKERGRYNIILTCSEDSRKDLIVPMMDGGIRHSLARLMDMEAYLEVIRTSDGIDLEEDLQDGVQDGVQETWRLDIQPHSQSPAEVKCRPRVIRETHGLYVVNPNITELLDLVNKQQRKNLR